MASDPIRSCSVTPTADLEQAAVRAVRSGVWVGGVETAKLEEEFASWLWGALDPNRVVAVSSGTAALTALLLAQGVGPGDDVIVPAATFTATGIAVLRAGARPVFADVSPTFTLEPEAIEEVLTPQTAAVIAVDFDGVPADWKRIEASAATDSLLLIEDACPAYGARAALRPDPERFGANLTAPAGLLGRHGAAFSLNESKQLPAGEGGLVVAPSANVAERIRRMRHFGHPVSGQASVELIADNWKITEVAAALAREGLKGLHERVMTAQLHGQELREAVQAGGLLSVPPVPKGSEPSWFRIRVLAPDSVSATRVACWLEDQGLPLQLSQEVFPLPDHPIFMDFPHGDLTNARQLSRSFCIGGRAKPVFTLDPAEARKWAEVITSLPAELVSP